MVADVTRLSYGVQFHPVGPFGCTTHQFRSQRKNDTPIAVSSLMRASVTDGLGSPHEPTLGEIPTLVAYDPAIAACARQAEGSPVTHQ